jgi:UDP:flavonoid glycosyltransferase YjiC (YdhE family)
MKFLFVTGGSWATVFALTPLATAVRNAGHEIFMAANEELVPAITGNGIPAVGITQASIRDFIFTDRDGRPVTVPQETRDVMLHVGRSFARLAEAGLDTLLTLVRDWRPDVVVGGSAAYGASLVAAHLGVPYVRHTWDTVETATMDEGAIDVLSPQLRKLGRDRLPEPDILVDICPPALRGEGRPAAQPMRWIPGNQQRRLEPWMYTPDSRRRRALVTGGTRSFMPDKIDSLRRLTKSLAGLDLEVLIAAPEAVAKDLRPELGDVRIGWLPLDVVTPTCDVVLHHGGGVTAMTAMNSATPQLLAPTDAYLKVVSQPIADFGAGIVLDSGQDSAELTVRACQDLLSDPGYRLRARSLADQIASLPLPAQVVGCLEQLHRAAVH